MLHDKLGEPPGGCRYAAMRPFEVGDRLRIYYGSDNGRHNADKDRTGELYLAEFPAGATVDQVSDVAVAFERGGIEPIDQRQKDDWVSLVGRLA